MPTVLSEREHQAYLLARCRENINAPGQRLSLSVIADWASNYPEFAEDVINLRKIVRAKPEPRARGFYCHMGKWCTSFPSGIHSNWKTASKCMRSNTKRN